MSTTRAVPGRGALVTAAAGLALAVTLAGARTAPGQDAVAAAGAFLEYYAGVFTLLTLTGAVVFGVVAALRVLPPGPRVVVQALHRSAAVAAVGFLITHALLKIMEAHAAPLNLIIPTTAGWSGLGTIAGDLLILAAATGAVRGRYAASIRPWMWRALHCTVYVTWPIALAHGLLAGRPPKGWVTLGYVLCVIAVIGVLLIRSATTSRHEPPGSAPVPDPDSPHTNAPDPRTARADPRTAPTSAPYDGAPPPGGRTDPGPVTTNWTEPGPGTAGRAEAGSGGSGAAGARTTGPFSAAGSRTGPEAASFPDGHRVDDAARIRAATGTASYVDASRHAPGTSGSHTTGPFPATEPPPYPPTSGPFPAAGVPGAAPRGPFAGQPGFTTPHPPASGPFAAASDPSAEPFAFFRPAAYRHTAPAPAPSADSPRQPHGFWPRKGPLPPEPPGGTDEGFSPRTEPPAAGGADRARTAHLDPSGSVARTAPSVGPEFGRARSPHVGLEARGKKRRKGKRPEKSVDEQDAEFWESLRAERRDWTRP